MPNFTGLLITFGVTQAIGLVGAPIGIIAALCLWLLPSVQRPTSPPLYKLLAGYIVLMVSWSGYAAIALPGLP